jgi:hypothetical protein
MLIQSIFYTECYNKVQYAECHYAECCYAECHGTYSVSCHNYFIVEPFGHAGCPNAIMLSFFLLECHYTNCHYSESHCASKKQKSLNKQPSFQEKTQVKLKDVWFREKGFRL